jgi:hypothetical protein
LLRVSWTYPASSEQIFYSSINLIDRFIILASLQVVAKSGTVKKIKASDIARTMSADGCWFSADASNVDVDDYISLTDEEYVIIESGETVDLKFSPDTGGSDGQGTSIPSGFEEVSVVAVDNTCNGLRAGKAFITTKTEAYSDGDPSELKAKDILERGDLAVCEKAAATYFTLRFKAFASFAPYLAIPVGTSYTADR